VNKYWRLFQSTHGTINRRTFLHGYIVVTFLNMGIFWIVSVFIEAAWERTHHVPMTFQDGFQWTILSPLATVWFSFSVLVKRLRAISARLWPAYVVRAASAIGFLGVTTIPFVDPANPSHVAISAWIGFASAVSILAALVVGFAGDVFLILWLGVFSKDRVNGSDGANPPSTMLG